MLQDSRSNNVLRWKPKAHVSKWRESLEIAEAEKACEGHFITYHLLKKTCTKPSVCTHSFSKAWMQLVTIQGRECTQRLTQPLWCLKHRPIYPPCGGPAGELIQEKTFINWQSRIISYLWSDVKAYEHMSAWFGWGCPPGLGRVLMLWLHPPHDDSSSGPKVAKILLCRAASLAFLPVLLQKGPVSNFFISVPLSETLETDYISRPLTHRKFWWVTCFPE